MDTKPFFDSIYDKLILRDLVGKVVPGSVLIFAVAVSLNYPSDLKHFLESIHWVMLMVGAGLAWLMGFVLQGIGESIFFLKTYPGEAKSNREEDGGKESGPEEEEPQPHNLKPAETQQSEVISTPSKPEEIVEEIDALNAQQSEVISTPSKLSRFKERIISILRKPGEPWRKKRSEAEKGRKDFFTSWSKFQRMAEPHEKIHAERLNIIKEACGNGAVALIIGSIIVLLVLVIRYFFEEVPLFIKWVPLIILLILAILAGWVLKRMHIEHVERYGKFVAGVLKEIEETGSERGRNTSKNETRDVSNQSRSIAK